MKLPYKLVIYPEIDVDLAARIALKFIQDHPTHDGIRRGSIFSSRGNGSTGTYYVHRTKSMIIVRRIPDEKCSDVLPEVSSRGHGTDQNAGHESVPVHAPKVSGTKLQRKVLCKVGHHKRSDRKSVSKGK